MSLIRSFVHATMEIANELHETSPKERDIVKRGAKNLAAAYTMDLFRAADFIVNVTKGISGEAVMKIVMPSSFDAIKATNEELSKAHAQEETQPDSPEEKPAFTLNPKPWTTSRPNPYIPTPTPCSPSARD